MMSRSGSNNTSKPTHVDKISVTCGAVNNCVWCPRNNEEMSMASPELCVASPELCDLQLYIDPYRARV